MGLRSRLTHAWRNLVHKAAVEQELDDELRMAEETLRDRYVAQGMSEAAARRAARAALGGEPVRDAVRDVRAGVRLEMLLSDVRYAGRALRKAPAFTAAAVLSLALGIGANTTIFTFINALALSPLPVEDPSALVEIAARGSEPAMISFPMYRDLAARQQVLTGMVATAGETPVRVTVPSGPPARRQRSTTCASASSPATTSRCSVWLLRRGGCSCPRTTAIRAAPRPPDRSSC